MVDTEVNSHIKVLDLGPEPTRRIAWLKELWAYREVLGILARKDFQTRYKRASFGVIWAVALPLLQGIVFVVIFSKVGRFHNLTFNYTIYVMSGVLSFAYFGVVAPAGSTAIVDGASLTDKVWFPRSVLVLVPVVSNAFSLCTSMVILLVAMPIVGAHYSWRLLLIPPAMLLLVMFCTSLSLVTSALHVYFRDVKFIVSAAMLIWFYVTPIVYPASSVHSIGPYLAYNPMTGIVNIFQFAAAGAFGPMAKGIYISIGVTLVLLVLGMEGNRRKDRLFVDKL